MARTFDEMLVSGTRVEKRPVEFLPDPEPRTRKYLIFSVDDHVCEARDTFTARVPARLRDAVPRVVPDGDGGEAWLVDGELRRWIGGDSIVGRRLADESDLLRTLGFADMRPGTYDIHARIRDMDLDGVYASVCFPSMIWGFCGQRISALEGPELALACVRAYNDWVIEEWAGPYRERIIPASVPYLRDAATAAEEVRRNAERGFKAVHFTENPEKLGLPSLHTGYWDPFIAACEETDTAVNIHLGTASTRPTLSSDTPIAASSLLWPAQTMSAAADWVYSKIPIRFPRVKLVLSEGGIGWVSVLRERMERAYRERGDIQWGDDPSPADLLVRNFWFCCIEEPRSMRHRYEIGVDRIMLESDYPHADTSWPNTQARVDDMLRELPRQEVRAISYANAADVYRHPVPDDPAWAR